MKKLLSLLLRKLGLIRLTDKVRFYLIMAKTHKARKTFTKQNPTVILPPPYFLYETFNLNYHSYYNKSFETAEWLVNHIQKHTKLDNANILDWGCGSGRVIRHLPLYINKPCHYYGTDYNNKYIQWCKQNLKGVTFSTNKLRPPLEYKSDFFDVIYGISIFTHLSEEMHYAWFNELMRVLKPKGILFLTLHGKIFINTLTQKEKQDFTEGKLIVKGNTKEGHRTFTALHPDAFIKKLVGKNIILEHICGKTINGKSEQDIWIIQKA